jgi:hypothetical protein
MHRYVKISEIVASLHVDEAFVRHLAADEIIQLKETAEGDALVSAEDAERVRIVLLLTSELEVNWAGVEVIMHMRESMLSMQRQFSEILETLVEEGRRQLRR